MQKAKKKIIMVFGTFDILHPGHINFFEQARKLVKEPFLIVSVARDFNVKKIKNNTPLNKEGKRLEQVSLCSMVDKAVLGGKSNYLKHILKENPDIIALGYDQSAYVNKLKTDIRTNSLKIKIRRLQSHKPHLYKTSLHKKMGGF